MDRRGSQLLRSVMTERHTKLLKGPRTVRVEWIAGLRADAGAQNGYALLLQSPGINREDASDFRAADGLGHGRAKGVAVAHK